MRPATLDLEHHLDQLAREARSGDRLPTIRELMQRFGASQMLVQRAFQNLKDRGLIQSQIGRGTFWRVPGGVPVTPAGEGQRSSLADRSRPPDGVKSVLLLRRSVSTARGRLVTEWLQRRLAAAGHLVLELSYSDPDHGLAVLRGLPRFDACVVQSTYKIIPTGLLSALKEKSNVLAVDGAALAGADVEAVGTEWGEPLAAAVTLLQQQGHDRIAYATTSLPFLASQLGRRRFESLRKTLQGVELHEITLALQPDEDYATALVDRLKTTLNGHAQLPFTALVAWGIEDGAQFRRQLSDVGIIIPAALSVVLLGRTDLVNEHADFFHTVGCSVVDQAEALHQAILARWADPSTPYGVHLIPVTERAGASVAPPPKPARRRSGH